MLSGWDPRIHSGPRATPESMAPNAEAKSLFNFVLGLENLSSLRLREPEESGWFWWFMRSSASPMTRDFCARSHSTFTGGGTQAFVELAPLPRATMSRDRPVNLVSNGSNHATRAARLRSQRAHSLGQQQLRCQQRAFRLAMHQRQRPVHQLHLRQRPLVRSEEPFVLPTPAIKFASQLSRQSFAVEHVGQQPNVVLLFA